MQQQIFNYCEVDEKNSTNNNSAPMLPIFHFLLLDNEENIATM
jgi:hypothetical protein